MAWVGVARAEPRRPRPQRTVAGVRPLPPALVGLVLALGLGACGGGTPSAGKTNTTGAARPPLTTTSAPPASSPHGPVPTTPTTKPPITTRPPTSRPSTTRPSTSRSSTSRAPTTTPRRTTTTTAAQWRPRAPQGSPYAATSQLLTAWSAHNRAAALKVASPAAVARLFALKYPSAGLLQDGCSTPPANAPSSCTYRYGSTQDLLSVSVTNFASGWGVTGVQLES